MSEPTSDSSPKDPAGNDPTGSNPAGNNLSGNNPAGHTPEPTDLAKTFRIGHKERDEAIEILREAAGDGRITVEELDERMDAVQSAKFPVDLDEVLADLTTALPSDRYRAGDRYRTGPTSPGALSPRPAPGRPAIPGQPGAPASRVPATYREGWDSADPLVVRATWETTYRRGRWDVPPFIRCEPTGSTVELNFLEITTDLREIEIEVKPGMGGVTLIVPEEWGVNVDRLSTSWGSVKSTVSSIPQGPYPTIYVDGSIGMGTFRARLANYFERRRLGKS